MGKITDLWSTPRWLFDELNEKYGPFDLDACATRENAKCQNFISEETDCLMVPWNRVGIKRVWMNPPYSNPYLFLKRAKEQSKEGLIVVCLINYDHTTKWWKELIENPDRGYEPYTGVRIVKLPKRIKFDPPPSFEKKISTNTRPS